VHKNRIFVCVILSHSRAICCVWRESKTIKQLKNRFSAPPRTQKQLSISERRERTKEKQAPSVTRFARNETRNEK
jgi:hypothetical protein